MKMSKAKYPSMIKIGPKRYKVEIEEPPKMTLGKDEQARETGLIEFLQGVITVRNMPSLDEQRHALMHEIIHGVFYAMSEYELCNNEKLVDNMAEKILGLIQDNDMSFFEGKSHSDSK